MTFVDRRAPVSDDTLYELTALACDFSWVYDASTQRFVHLGGRCEEMIGQGELASPQTFSKRLPPEELARITEAMEDGEFHGVVQLARPDGQQRWLDLRMREHGSLQYGIARDVTGQRQVERTLSLLQEATATATGDSWLRELVRCLGRALAVRYAFVGELVAPGRIRARFVWAGDRLGSPFEFELAPTPCARVVREGRLFVPSKLGEAYPDFTGLAELKLQSYLGQVIMGQRGEPLGVLAIAHDQPCPPFEPQVLQLLEVLATHAGAELERLQADAAVRRSERELRAILNGCPDGVWLGDLEGRSVWVNERLCQLLGADEKELIGRSMFEFIADGEAQARIGLERRKKGSLTPAVYEVRARTRDHGELWVRASTAVVCDEERRPSGIVCVISDVTERRLMESRLRYSQKLEGLGVLAGAVAHDFNNLLVGILANASIAKNASSPGSRTAEALDDIGVAAHRAAELTRQLLAYSGHGRFIVERTDLNAMIDDMRGLISAAVSKKANLELTLAPSLPPMMGDPAQIKQLAMNLLANASRALADGPGTIRVSTGVERLDRAQLDRALLGPALLEGDYLVLTVSDTGQGMNAATLTRIFEPFFTTWPPGRGLGLATVLGVLKAHSGAVEVRSAPGEGSTFRVYFPASQAPAPVAVPRDAVETRAVRGGLVLVVDDEVGVRRAAERTLEAAGFSIISAVNGREALERYLERQDEVVCVVSDLTMPGLSGDELLLELRRVRPQLPVVLMSGYSEADAGARTGTRAPSAFVGKPWEPDALVAAVRGAIARALDA